MGHFSSDLGFTLNFVQFSVIIGVTTSTLVCVNFIRFSGRIQGNGLDKMQHVKLPLV